MPELRTVLAPKLHPPDQNLRGVPEARVCSALEQLGAQDREPLRLPRLSTLQLADNRLRDADDVRHLLSCPNVTVLDLQNNKLDDPALLGVLEAMPQLAVLQLQGNPLVGKVKQYRRTVISRCKSLTYLDDPGLRRGAALR